MSRLIQYKDLNEVLQSFLAFLLEANTPRVASVYKYARVNNNEITLKATKKITPLGLT